MASLSNRKRKQVLLSIFVLVIVSPLFPFYDVVAFLPPTNPLNNINQQHQSSIFPTHDSDHHHCEKQRNKQQRHYGAMTTTTTTTMLHVSPEIIGGTSLLVAVGGFAGWLYIDGADGRDRRRRREEEEARYEANQAERARQAYIEPKEYWTESEIAPYDGSRDEGDGPILLAADGLVFNVYKGRNFYLPGCEYNIFVGRDATRLLARNKVEEESEEDSKRPLNIAERAFLAGWIYTFKGKYDIVGKLEGFDPETTAM